MRRGEVGTQGMRDAQMIRRSDCDVCADKFSLSLSAIYLCKRTMQNKTRLELADYEAVSVELALSY